MIIKRKLTVMPYDKTFEVDGQLESCRATGFEMLRGGIWWNEYIDSNADLHYGN